MAKKSGNTPYVDRVHQALTDNLDGFNLMPPEFNRRMLDPAYAARAHQALSENLEGFNKPLPDFHKAVSTSVTQRDNTRVTNPIKSLLPNSQTRDFLTWLKNKTSPEEADAFNSVRYENGNPSVNMINGRSNYTFYNNTMNVDTSGRFGSPAFSGLSELAHSKQYADFPLSYIANKIKDDIALSEAARYSTNGAIENQAHSTIQPQLKKQYQGRLNLNSAKGTALANDKDFISDAYTPIKYPK